jgi:hypothetical protein
MFRAVLKLAAAPPKILDIRAAIVHDWRCWNGALGRNVLYLAQQVRGSGGEDHLVEDAYILAAPEGPPEVDTQTTVICVRHCVPGKTKIPS